MKLCSTRNSEQVVDFSTAVVTNMPPSGGLYVPTQWPVFEDWGRLLSLSFKPRAVEILTRLLGDEFSTKALGAAVERAFGFPAPVRKVEDRVFALELFHGPSLAFKDFGARFLAAILEQIALARGAAQHTLLTATSGDTGAAVAQAFWKIPGFRVVVLYPKGRVSPLQERQFASLGDNVSALAVDGNFDDCQRLVKQCFADPKLSKELGLLSANSINFARLLAQTLYYVEAVAQLHKLGVEGPLVFSVPSGNFGNLCAGLLAQKWGLPIQTFVAATNANDTVPQYLETGRYQARASVQTLSNAMDVGDPSNWERIDHLFGKDLSQLNKALRFGRFSDAQTTEVIQRLARGGYVCDPHGAVAYGVLQQNLKANETGVFLATAHPAKFREVMETALGAPMEIPQALSQLQNRPVLSRNIPVDLGTVRTVLLEGNWPT